MCSQRRTTVSVVVFLLDVADDHADLEQRGQTMITFALPARVGAI
jgi:hypothetical protein